ncbi:PHD finger protein-like protein [Tanacetum coccineum]
MLNVEVRDGSAIWLRNLIKNLLAEGTQNQVKDTLLIRVEIEDDVNVRISLCHMLAKAFIVFDVDNWGPELSDQSPNVGTRLEMLLEQLIGKPLVIVLKTSLKIRASATSAILLKKLLEESLAKDTQFHEVKHILLSRVEIEDDGNVMKSLCRTIAKAFIVFGGENWWPDLFPYILYFLENQTNAEIHATIANKGHISALVGCSKKSSIYGKRFGHPFSPPNTVKAFAIVEDTQIQVKHILLSRVVTEDVGIAFYISERLLLNATSLKMNQRRLRRQLSSLLMELTWHRSAQLQPNLLSTSYGANVKECFVKEWDFGIGNKELMLLTCRVLPSFDELETELTRLLPPGDVVMVTPWMTIGQLREKTQSALRAA